MYILYRMLGKYLSLRYCMIFKTNYSPFLEKIICRCNLPCRDGGHFHCPFCGTTIIRKDTIMPHLIQCKNKCDMAQLTLAPPSQPLSPETHPPVLSSMRVEHSYTLPPTVSAVKIEHSYTQTASPKTPDLSQSLAAPNSEDSIASKEEVNGDVPPTHVRCPHCPVVLYKRNLFLHIQRKHGQVKDTTSRSHLQSTPIDHSNGLYAVRKTSRGFSAPESPCLARCKTWGQQHVTRCEMDVCFCTLEYLALEHSRMFVAKKSKSSL